MLAFYKFLNLEVFFLCVCTCVFVYCSTHMEVRGQIFGVSSLFPPRDSQGSNSGLVASTVLPVQPSHKPETFSLKAQSLAGCGITGF